MWTHLTRPLTNTRIVAFDHRAQAASGGFVEHGAWDGRTERPSSAFFDLIAASGIMSYYPLAEEPVAPSGNLKDLSVDSHRDAFWTAVRSLTESQ